MPVDHLISVGCPALFGGSEKIVFSRGLGRRQVGECEAEPDAPPRRELSRFFAGAGNKDGRQRLLDWTRPDRNVAEVVMLAFPAEWFGVAPGADDKLPGFLEAGARFRRRYVVHQVLVRRTSQEASDEPTS
jgi:hypothetical protein